MDAEDAKKGGLLVSTQAEIEEMDRVGAVEEAEKSAGDKEGSGQTSEDENAAPSMNGKGSEGKKSASVLYDNAQVQDNAADNKTDNSKSAEQTSPKDKTVDEAKLTMGTEKEAKFAAEVKAKMEEDEAKAKVEMEKKKAKEEHEKNMYAGPKWTPLKRPGERKKSNNLMDYDFLPD